MSSQWSGVSRRRFLLLSAGAATAAGAALSSKQKAAPTGPDAAGQVKAAGYQATAHIRNYYRTARI